MMRNQRKPNRIWVVLINIGWIIAGVAFWGSTPPKPCLCQNNEENVYSFQTQKARKTASICHEKNGKYLVYRYGTPDKIELTFPRKLDASSWQQFEYRGYYRGGGPANAAMNEQSLSFTNQGVTYEIYEQSGYADQTTASFSQQAGIVVRVKGKEVNLKADLKTTSGTLQNLDQYDTMENKFGQ